MEVTNKQLMAYSKVLYDYYLKKYLAQGKYVRIDIYTKQSGYVVVSVYPCTDKSRQGIALYEGNETIDEPVDQVGSDKDSLYIARYNSAEYWTPEYARQDLEKAEK